MTSKKKGVFFMSTTETETEELGPIETTLGDLICAIADAALEARIDETDLSSVTQLILNDLRIKREE